MSYAQLATPVNLTGGTPQTVVAALSGFKVSITGFRVGNAGNTSVDLLLYDGATLRFRLPIPAGAGALLALQDDPAMPIIPLDQMTNGGALQAAISGSGSVWLNLYYRYGLPSEDL